MTTEKCNFNDAADKAKKQAENSVYVSLNDGDTVKGVFLGDVVIKTTHYLNETKRTVPCVGENCEYCNAGVKQSSKYYQNFVIFNEESGKYEVKVFGLSPKPMNNYKQALILAEATRENAVVAVKRIGEKLDTEYHFQVIKSIELPADIELLDIEKIV